MTTPAAPRRLLRLLYAGSASTLVVALAPLVDLASVDSIAGHVRDAYPQWSADSITADRNAIVIYLVAVGILGIAGWLWTLRLVVRRARSTRVVATILFALGALTALTSLSYGAAPYDTIVPMPYGLVGLVPVLIGAGALVEVWRQPAALSGPARPSASIRR